MIVAYLPRILLGTNATTEFSPRTVRILDLTNFFAVGVFLATCFVMLTPHVESSFVSAFASVGWETETSHKLVQVVIVLGFLLIYFLEKILDHCKNSVDNMDDLNCSDLHGEPNSGVVSNYVVTFEPTGHEEEIEDEVLDELNQNENRSEVKKYGPKQVGSPINIIKVTNGADAQTDDEDEEDDGSESRRLVGDGGGGKPLNIFRSGEKNKVAGHEQNNESLGRKRITGASQSVPLSIDSIVGQIDVRCTAMLIALCVHSVFEGVTLGLQSQLWHFVVLAGAVTIHQVVAAAAVGVSLTRRRLGRLPFLISSSFFSGAIPFGVLIGIILSNFADTDYKVEPGVMTGSPGPTIASACLQALTVGTFIYVIFIEILPSESNKRRDQVIKAILLMSGFILISCLAFFLAKS